MNELKEIIVENLETNEKQKLKSFGDLIFLFKENDNILKFITLNENRINNILEHSYNCFVIENWQITFIAKKKSTKKKKGNGQGSIYFDNTRQCWAGQYTYNGKRKSPIYQRKTENKTEFIARFNDLLASISNGTYIEKNKDTLYNVLKRYIEQKYIDGITRDRAYVRNTQTLKAIEKSCSNFIYKSLQNITVEDIEDSKIEIKKYSQTSINKIWSLLQKGFKIATTRRKIQYNIMDDESLTKPISDKTFEKVVPLTSDEEKKLIEVLDGPERYHKYRNIVKLELITSARIGEVLARSVDDIDIINNTLHIHNTLTTDKNGNYFIGKHTKTYDKVKDIDYGMRFFPLNGELKELLTMQLNNKVTNIHKLIFWDYENNTFITPSEVNSWLIRINKKYNICKRLHNHKLRHTRITRWKEQGMDLEAIQYLAGHVEGSGVTQDVYIDISKEFAFEQLNKIQKNSTAS